MKIIAMAKSPLPGGRSLPRTAGATCSLAAVTLGDIHNAVGAPALLAMGNRTESPGCIVEQAVNAALDGAFQEAEALLLKRFNSITLADLSRDFHRRMTGGGFTLKDIEHAP